MNALLTRLMPSSKQGEVNPKYATSPEFEEWKQAVISAHHHNSDNIDNAAAAASSLLQQQQPAHGGNCHALSDQAIFDEFHHPTDLVLETVWYFAYGSNLSFSVLEQRRNIQPLQVFPAHLPGYELVFDLHAMPYLEPAMGNIKPSEEGGMHGAAFRLTQAQLNRVLETEGGGTSYQLLEVDVHLYAPHSSTVNGDPVRAFTLMCVNRYESVDFPLEAVPSHRYLTLIQEGARARGLAPEWIANLDGRRKMRPLTGVQKLGVTLVLLVNLPLFAALFVYVEVGRWWRGEDSSKRFYNFFNTLKDAMWTVWQYTPLPARKFLVEHRVV